MFETASQTVYTVAYISVLQTLNDNESIGIKVYSPDTDADVAAAAINGSLKVMIRCK